MAKSAGFLKKVRSSARTSPSETELVHLGTHIRLPKRKNGGVSKAIWRIYNASTRAEAFFPLFLATVEAGFPSPADDYLEGRNGPHELLIQNGPARFVRARGESMNGDHPTIQDGDLLSWIIQIPENGRRGDRLPLTVLSPEAAALHGTGNLAFAGETKPFQTIRIGGWAGILHLGASVRPASLNFH